MNLETQISQNIRAIFAVSEGNIAHINLTIELAGVPLGGIQLGFRIDDRLGDFLLCKRVNDIDGGSLRLSTPIMKVPKAELNATKVPMVRTAAPPEAIDCPISFTTIRYKTMVEPRVMAGLITLFQLL